MWLHTSKMLPSLAHVTEQRFELRALCVFAGGFVDEHLAHLEAFQLPIRVLVECTDPYVANPLSEHVAFPAKCVWLRF